MVAGLISASGFGHPASTLPTRFPTALGIGHGSAFGLANACALVYDRCLSMLRNTGDGNELAMPPSMPCKEHSVAGDTVLVGLGYLDTSC